MFYLFALALPGGDRAEMVAYVERLNTSPAVGAVAFPLIICVGLGMLTLAWAASRAGLVGWWGPALVTTAVLIHFVLPDEKPAAGDARAARRADRSVRSPGVAGPADERRRVGAVPGAAAAPVPVRA